LRVVRLESKIRLSEEYLSATTPYVRDYKTPPLVFDEAAQKKALDDSGFSYD
jgi:hypothetical protein